MNAELCRKAVEKVGNPNILVNLISKRVRQLNAAGGATTRPLLSEIAGMGVGDIALAEFVEEKMSWEALEIPAQEAQPKGRRRRS